jgi:predicted RNA-binding protein
MCQSNAYFKKGDTEELILEDVAKIEFKDDNIIKLVSLFGEEREVKGELEEVNLLSHKIFITSAL